MDAVTESRLLRFGQTHWSEVVRARGGSSAEQLEALDGLCRSYWLPLYVFLRGTGRTQEDAADLVQEFFLRLMEGRLLAEADPEKGRFRTFILSSLRNLERDFHRSEQAQKRGGAVEKVPLDVALAERIWKAEAGGGFSPDAAFDRAWAAAVIESAGRQLKDAFGAEGKAALFAELFPRIAGAVMSDDVTASAQRLGVTEAAARTAMSRMRRRYAGAIRARVAETVGSRADEEDELRYLLANFS